MPTSSMLSIRPSSASPCLGCEFCARLCPMGALDMSAWLEEMIEATKKHLPVRCQSLGSTGRPASGRQGQLSSKSPATRPNRPGQL